VSPEDGSGSLAQVAQGPDAGQREPRGRSLSWSEGLHEPQEPCGRRDRRTGDRVHPEEFEAVDWYDQRSTPPTTDLAAVLATTGTREGHAAMTSSGFAARLGSSQHMPPTVSPQTRDEVEPRPRRPQAGDGPSPPTTDPAVRVHRIGASGSRLMDHLFGQGPIRAAGWEAIDGEEVPAEDVPRGAETRRFRRPPWVGRTRPPTWPGDEVSKVPTDASPPVSAGCSPWSSCERNSPSRARSSTTSTVERTTPIWPTWTWPPAVSPWPRTSRSSTGTKHRHPGKLPRLVARADRLRR